MDLPSPSARITNIASRLSLLPAELIDPVVAQLPLHRVLELACAPTAGPVLLWSIEHSPRWSWLFRDRLPQLQQLWESLNLLSWIWCRRSLMRVPALIPLGLGGGESTARSREPNAGADFLKRLQRDFLDSFLQLLPTEHSIQRRSLRRAIGFSKAQFDAVCHFLPPGSGTIANDPSIFLLHKWKFKEAQDFLPDLALAYRLLNEAKSAELSTLADLYERFPAVLKEPLAPQTPAPRKNTRHIPGALRFDAAAMLVRPVRTVGKVACGSINRRNEFYRFRYPHPALIPNNPCLKLFRLVLDMHPLPGTGESSIYPSDLLPDLRRALEGLMLIYRHDKGADHPRCIDDLGITIRHVSYARSHEALPCPQAELDWLRSFARSAQWMMTELPDVARSCQVPRLLLGPEDYRNYIATESASVIAHQLVLDESLAEHETDSRLPTLLALYMPPASSSLGREVARVFWPDEVDTSIQSLLYEETIKTIKRGLGKKAPEPPRHPDGHVLASDTRDPAEAVHGTSGAKRGKRHTDTQWDDSLAKYLASQGPAERRYPTCYICRIYNPTPHKTLSSMCRPCGHFNLAGSSLSLPNNLDLRGRVALVTGARVNLGYHTALRLLRCGARVIVSTRYPRDAVSRYRSEPNSHLWQDRLKVVGADFRAARDAFDLVVQVRAIVSTWGGKLDILINNAAQTLTDSIGKEEKAIERELLLQGHDVEKPDQSKMLVSHGYQARVRGGMGSQSHEISGPSDGKTIGQPAILGTSNTDALDTLNTRSSPMEVSSKPGASSWVQSLSEIPYEDIISAHSINTFVPLILIRELMPLMRRNNAGDSTKEKVASGYIVNVSSREGIFESTNTSGAKNGKHVHTNMTKAGLNMITETEASTAWQNYGVAMNTVDPGYMSAAPEFEDAHGGERPIGWEDGAGRVLWPVGIGEMAKNAVQGGNKGRGHIQTVWGRFLKHYGAVRVDVRLGRG